MPPPPPASRLPWWGQAWRVVVALLASLTVWVLTLESLEDAGFSDHPLALWVLVGDPLLCLLLLVLVVVARRRLPLAVALTTALLTALSPMAFGPATLALCSLATRRRPRELLLAGGTTVVAALAFESVYPEPSPLPLWAAALLVSLFVAVVLAVGWSVGADRERLVSFRERAETSEREQQARVAAARAAERTRIAREMHDVLAHRISLVAMHAGALTFRTDLSPEQQAQTARTIEENAHLALRDLRDVLGVLRADGVDAAPAPERPQPGLADLPQLVAEARAAGTRLGFEDRTDGAVPPTTGRTVYRLVQEALTNARKHAPGCPVTVSVEGRAGAAVEVVVANPLPVGAGATLPGAGLGLLGLHERVDLLGGVLRHGPEEDRFVVRASLPWAA
ncbi:sensor histidine kinase [Arthrobacter sp. NEB 688]|uniref:sensor histidine kinase n=1 Tax=Arthrobacter sp. NEB 688 TaxID=904039 RepID=UPI001565B391|nr:sensor histidine kinase [Arthrobacter sp. NEB 688]QKE83644.1 sensor histidine kinase [Arthrobacter sp. NEB 688]